MSIENGEQFEGMRAAGAVVAETLRRVGAALLVGVTPGKRVQLASGSRSRAPALSARPGLPAPGADHEHTIMIRRGAPLVLTAA